MKKIISASLVTMMAITGASAISNAELAAKLNDLESELAKVKKKLKKQNKKINKVKAHDSGDNIKWGVDLRTGLDNISYDMADGSKQGKHDLLSMRLWLNMAYAPDANNVFKGQLSMNKAFGADFAQTGLFNYFDWTTNEALNDNAVRVRQAYWLYLGESAFGLDMPWTFSLGRRPSTGGFLANLREDDSAQSPLGHVINVEFDGLSSKLDLSNVTGIPGMSIKLCMGKGSTNAVPLIGSATPNANDNASTAVEDITLAGFIFEPYNDGQYIVKASAYKGFDVPDANFNAVGQITNLTNLGDMDGAALSVLVDGLTDEGYFADAKIFGSFAWTKTHPNGSGVTFPTGDGVTTVNLPGMLGSTDSETGTSYWFGAQLPVTEDGVFGVEYNHGSQYWRPFTYAEDTMAGSKLAVRGDAFEVYFTYQLTDALSAQARYTVMNYDYTGSNGFFGSTTGASNKISDIKAAAAAGNAQAQAQLPNIVEKAQDARVYLRYRF